MNNRVEMLLKEIRQTIDERRIQGDYPKGYEASIENEHLGQFGIDPSRDAWLESQLQLVAKLQAAVNTWSPIEEDTSRNKIIRLVREVAMSRHQLRRMNREVAQINQQITEILVSLVTETAQIHERRTAILSSELHAVAERAQLIDGMVVVVRGLEKQVSELQAQIQNQK
jgi:hypothetical protein